MADAPNRRVFLPDIRGNEQFLRATWHPDRSAVVISHWAGEVCTASTPIALADTSKLIGLLVDALQDAATQPEPQPGPAPVDSPARRLRARLVSVFRPHLAPVIALRSRVGTRSERRTESQ